MTTVLPAPRGNKHTCSQCQTRFYDLNSSPAACPQCHHKVPVLKAVRRKRRTAPEDGPQEERDPAHYKVVETDPKPKNVKWKIGYR